MDILDNLYLNGDNRVILAVERKVPAFSNLDRDICPYCDYHVNFCKCEDE